MFSHSQSQTPIPSGIQYHEKLAETVTWVKDWYTPQLTLNTENVPNLIRLKGWYKTNINHKAGTSLRLSEDDVLDLSNWKYGHSTPQEVNVVDNQVNHTPVTNELKEALVMKNEEGEIRGLG